MDSIPPLLDLTANLPATTGQNSRKYSEEERMRAIAIYAETNSFAEASRVTGIDSATIRQWFARDTDGELAQLVVTLRSAIRERAAWRYVETVELAQAETIDRLRNGDPYVMKGGQVVYAPVKARDAMLIASIAQDKLASLMAGMDTNKGAGAALASLAGRLVTQLERAQQAEDAKALDTFTG